MTGASPRRQIPQLAGQLGGVVVAGLHDAHPGAILVGQVELEVVRPHPHAFTELTETLVVQSRSQRRAGTGIGADAGDNQRGPVAVPRPQLGTHGVVLPALASEQSISEPVAVGGPDQVAGADHPGQRDPQRGLLDAEVIGEPDQFGCAGPRRMGAEQHAEHHRPGGHAGQRFRHGVTPGTRAGRNHRTARRGA